MGSPQINFRLTATDPFQVQLDEVVKTLRYGQKSVFFVKLTKTLFGGMSLTQMRNTMVGIVQGEPEVLADLLAAALARLNGNAEFTSEPAEKAPQQPVKKRVLTALCD